MIWADAQDLGASGRVSKSGPAYFTQGLGDGWEGEHDGCDQKRRDEGVDVDGDGVQVACLQEEDGDKLEGHARSQPDDDVRPSQQPGNAVGGDVPPQHPPSWRDGLVIFLCIPSTQVSGPMWYIACDATSIS